MDWIVTQGLGADQLVTQGWSSGTLSPSLISQGLGGPQIVLQGLVGTGKAVLISASGGLNIGGQAGVQFSAAAKPQGGMTSGGAAKSAASVHVLSCGHSGLGGSAQASATFTVLARGGLVLGAQMPGEGAVSYHVYANTGAGDAINYTVCLATVTGQSWTSSPLSPPGYFKLGVRAFDLELGLEEQNIDAVVDLVLDANGNDVTGVPAPPLGQRAFPIAGGNVRVEWTYPGVDPSRQPLGFHVYLGTGAGSMPDYTQPVSTVAWSSARYGSFSSDLAGPGNGSPCSIGVRGYNAVGEEQNTTVLYITSDGSPPTVVDSLQALATNQEP